ncbi:MAG TPA: 2-C-methyl-D-erythritol 4-phosphate cytidylyltransferase, partial [Mycobacteriales bacterium]|nr:2-C-methyl-D-erythritol 4-phosphate cytidylyltransferase [Mycobacteriales bacterium]
MTTAAIVAAAGSGERLGAGLPKALVRLGHQTLLQLSVAVMDEAGIDVVVVTAPPSSVPEFAALVPTATVVAGGETRQESVRAGLAALPDDVDVVLVHDAARALVPTDVVHRVIDALRDGAEAVVPVVALADTVKEVDSSGAVVRTVNRASLRAVQTPQGFRRSVLERAHGAGGAGATDDAALVEALGVTVTTVEGSAEALKVTTPLDLVV